ncbi:hypothetical protein C8J56DRAFT_1050998 [Mycena floridula]|nr:hypothetical protein C8J56DRAFT_1050998 [Mycena floridula]
MSEPLNDPLKESCPAFGSAAFETIIQKIVTERKITRKEAIQDLTTDWEESHAERVAAFKAEKPDPPEEPEPATNNQKVPKVNAALAVPTVHDAIPSFYAIDKLEKYSYIELWYFTPEGCEDNALSQRLLDTKGYGLSRGDSSSAVTLKLISSLKTSSKIVADSLFSWEQFELDSTSFLQAIEPRANWPKEIVGHFQGIKNHSMRQEKQGVEEIGKSVLICYADIIRVDWHDHILQDKETFSIGIINEDLIIQLRFGQMTAKLESSSQASSGQYQVSPP